MDAIAVVANSLLVLDHHETAKQLIGRPYAHIDESACGCALVWDYLYPHVELPTLVKYIDDGDRYTLALPSVFEFLAALSNQDKSFEVWSELLHMTNQEVDAFIESGRAILKFNSMRVNEIASESFPITICGVAGLATNGAKFYSTLVGEVLAKQTQTFGAVFFMRPDGNVEVSLRSVGLDVEAMAKTFGGGGHVKAAGFSLPNLSFLALFDEHARKLLHAHQVDVALEAFGSKLSAMTDHSIVGIGDALMTHLSDTGGILIDDVSIRTYFRNTDDNLTFNSYISWMAYLFGAPARETVKKWYHRILPYKVVINNVFNEDEISNLLNQPRTSDGGVDITVADKLLNTVKPQYTATLCIQKTCEVEILLPEQSIRIQRSFEI